MNTKETKEQLSKRLIAEVVEELSTGTDRTLWVKAQAEQVALGWTYDVDFITQIRDEAENDCGYDATLEFTEAVMKIADRLMGVRALLEA